MSEELYSKPNFADFSPRIIPYQSAVVDYLDDWDFSSGTPEILLSGSYGCLSKDSLIETVDGPIPISDITSQHYVLSYHEQTNQFVYQQGSGAYPKGKGILYRVTSEHGEFVASGHHLVATSLYGYRQVSCLNPGDVLLSGSIGQPLTYSSGFQLWSPSNVLRSFGILASFLAHYVARIRQYDPQLQKALEICLKFFPLQADAQAHGQFFYNYKCERMDDFLELEKELFRIFESHDQICSIRSARLSGHLVSVLEDEDFLPTTFEHTFSNILQYLLFRVQDDHPKVLLLNLYRICILFESCFSCHLLPNVTNESKVIKIEEIGEDWYWDLQVPNTNNYVSGGHIHHNSAKSILMAHLTVRHCIENPGARVCLARKALPDLKDTIFKEILEHINEDFVEGKHYSVNHSSGKITWFNGSEIISRSWSDKKYKKGRSLKLSMLVFEELTENNEEDKQAFDTLKARLRRIPTVKENILIAATNPDSPGHWVFKYWFDEEKKTRRVFKSVTTDNPFLDPVYIEQLKQDLDPKSALRYIYGEWVEIDADRVYYAYNPEHNYLKKRYEINRSLPIILAFDFNIGQGKPMSSCAMQFDGSFHIFDEVVIQGARTADSAEEWISKGIVGPNQRIIIRGDASGDARDTRSILSDYDILKRAFSNAGAIVEMQVPLSNPPIRRRHNLVNAYCLNESGQHRLFVYNSCKVAHDGMRLTALKKSGDYIEDDGPSSPYQHITTAIGYSVVYEHNLIGAKRVETSRRM